MNSTSFAFIGHVRRHWVIYVCRTKIAFAVILACMLSTATSADVNLIFGTYAADKPTETVKLYRPFLNYLSNEMAEMLGETVSIKMRISKEYEASIEHLAQGDVDFARFGPASYITVKELDTNVRIIAMESKDGKKRFNGVIAIHSKSDIQTLTDLAHHSFAFGDPLSTIGRYLAQSYLIDAGVTSRQLSGYDYLGRHDRVGAAVGAGRFTAGALKESTFKKLVESGVPIKVLFEFDNVTKPWIAASDLEPRIFNAIQHAMLNLSASEVLGRIAEDGFLEGTDADYDFIRIAMKHSSAF